MRNVGLDAVAGETWVSQDRYDRGVTNWKGLCLYSVSGAPDDLRCAGRPTIRKTAVGARS